MRLQAAAMLAAALALSAGAQAPVPSETPPTEFVEGTHYLRLPTPQPTSTVDGKVEVTEVFMFGCPSCFGLEPHLQQWLAKKPDYVNVVRVPAQWNGLANLHARAYYTALTLGKADAISVPFFDEVHVKGNHLDSETSLTEFFGRFGVDADTFKKTFYSFAVDAQLKRAEDLVKRYRVQSTPTVIVNGKFATTGTMARTYEAWFAIIDQLAAAEHAAAAQ